MNIDSCNNFIFCCFCFRNILRKDWQNLTEFCAHIIMDKIYVEIIKCSVVFYLQIWNRVMPLYWVRIWFLLNIFKVSGVEFDQILYKHYHWQYLRCNCKKKKNYFTNFIIVFVSTLDNRQKCNWFMINILRRINGHVFIVKITIAFIWIKNFNIF